MSKIRSEEFEQVRSRMLKNLNKSYLDRIYDYLELMEKRPWCGRIGLKWLLSLESQRKLANIACDIVRVPVRVGNAAFEHNFDQTLEQALSSGLRDIGRGLVYNDFNKYIRYWLAMSFSSYATFKVLGPVLPFQGVSGT